VKPDAQVDGHPATSKLDLFEAMLQKVLDTLDSNAALKAETALFITFDEGGGYYDSGFIQPLDFFGDGPRQAARPVPDNRASRPSKANSRERQVRS
jgi:phospholipase C